MSDNKKNSIECPFKDKISPQPPKGVSESDFFSKDYDPSDPYNLAGKVDFGNKAPATRSSQRDSRKDGKDFNKSAQEAADERHEIKEGEDHIKFGDGSQEDSTSLVLGRRGSFWQTRGAIVGISISEIMGVTMQGGLTIYNQGKSITKGWFTENFLSFLPSTIYCQVPSYLIKMPDMDLFGDGVTKELSDFISTFYKG